MAPLLPKNAYRLPYNIFNVFSCKTGKHDAYQTLTDTYHETVPPPPPKNAYRLPYSIFYWKSVYLPPKLVSTTLTMVSITLTKRHCPHTPIKIAYRLPNSICDALPLPTPLKRLPAYHGKHHASHEALPPPTSQKRLPLTIQHFRLKMDIFTGKTGKHDAYQTLTDAYHEAVAQTWGWIPPTQKRLPLTIQHFQLKIDIFTCKTGKHDAYQTLTNAYHEAVAQTRGWILPSQKRLPLTIQQFQLKIDVFTCKTGKHDAYQTLTDTYHEE